MSLCEECGKPVRASKVVNHRMCDYCERHARKKVLDVRTTCLMAKAGEKDE